MENRMSAKDFRQKSKKKSKFGNVKTNGYDSKKESERATHLKWMERCGQIHDLKEQVEFVLIPKQGKVRAVKYIADFVYTYSNGKQIVEDTKGMRTEVYKLKKKMMLYFYGIEIHET